jgi:hypothetical protein
VKKKMLIVAALTLTASILATARVSEAATSAAATTSYMIKATLNAKQEVPTPKSAIHATGTLTGKLTLAGKKSSFTWRLRVSHLSGRVVAAAVAVGAAGKRGPIILPLCNKCLATAHGSYVGAYVARARFVNPLLHGRLYVNVTTKLNPKGEIRGQVKATAASA